MSPEIIAFLRAAFLMQEKGYSPERVKWIRKWIGANVSQSEFGDYFHQTAEAVKSWEAPEGSDKHREVSGSASRVMQLLECMAMSRRGEKNSALERAIKSAKLRGFYPRMTKENNGTSHGKI
jgi:DNA-binding transcriptional regulator YiaG